MPMTMGRHIRCILFDLGSTLWTRQEEATAQAKKRAYTMAGTILRRSQGEKAFLSVDALALGALLHASIRKQIRQEKSQNPEYEPDFALATVEALRQLGLVNIDHALAEAIFEALRIRIPASRALFGDTHATLTALKQRGYILGVVTNRDYGGPLFREDLQIMGLLDYFDYAHMAISADLGVRKPHPDIFRYALRGLNVSPEETAMVGDNLLADVAGAKRLNMFAIWKPRPSRRLGAKEKSHPEREAIMPDATIEHLNDLLEIF